MAKPSSQTILAIYSLSTCRMRRSTTRNRSRIGLQEQMGYSFSCVLYASCVFTSSDLTSHQAGLFPVALAAFVIDSHKSLLPDSGSNTVALLTQISQQIANGSQVSAQPALSNLSSFQPTTSAVLVNALWYLSLVITLFCALLATLQQHWARRYLRLTQPQCAVHKRTRLRAFFAEGVERFQLAFAVEAIPALLHISMFLFLTGLVISLFAIHHTIAWVIFAATVACGIVYSAITIIPVFCHNSPYHSPFTALVWDIPRRTAKLSSLASIIY